MTQSEQKQSVLLSFIGKQDPFARKKEPTDPDTKGSLVSLVDYLLSEGNRQLVRILLLYSQDTEVGANDTRDWLQAEYDFEDTDIELIPISPKLSDDPINMQLATAEAQSALETAQALIDSGQANWIDFNASSGTPTMKQTWGIIQASGYVPESTVWQVRDPKFIKEGQQRFFSSDLTTLKTEFDWKVIQEQLNRYDYAGALGYITKTKSQFNKKSIRNLLEYGRSRFAFDFEEAKKKTQELESMLDPFSLKSVEHLEGHRPEALLREIYWKAKIELYLKNYSDFLVLLAAFLEHALKLEIKQLLKIEKNKWNKHWRKIKGDIWKVVNSWDSGKLRNHINKKSNEDNFPISYDFNRPTMMAILEYAKSPQLADLETIAEYAPMRNDYIHEMEGVSGLKVTQTDPLLETMKSLVRSLTDLPPKSSFDRLNEIIFTRLEEFR
jgi:hypothetical protein